MAGLSVIKTNNGLLNNSVMIKKTPDSLNYLENYTSNVYTLEDNLFIGWNTYNEYPIRSFETDISKFIIKVKYIISPNQR